MSPPAVADVVVAVLAGLAVAALVPAGSSPIADHRPPGARRPGWSVPVVVLGAALAGTAVWVNVSGTTLALVLILGALAGAVLRAVARRRRTRAADRRADRVLALCEGLASDLAAGQPPLRCLDRVALEWPEFAPVAVAGRMGADVPEVLRELAARPGARQLRILAASWAVAHRTGAGLAVSVDRAAEAIRSDRRTARLVSAELASARATARMLAVLPFGVLLLGSGIGGDPIGFLLTTPVGLGCLALGLALSVGGMAWLEQIADRVLRR